MSIKSAPKLGSIVPYVFLFLVGFPLAGALFGHVFYLVLDLAIGPLSKSGWQISVVVWATFAFVSGVYSLWCFRQYDKALKNRNCTRD